MPHVITGLALKGPATQPMFNLGPATRVRDSLKAVLLDVKDKTGGTKPLWVPAKLLAVRDGQFMVPQWWAKEQKVKYWCAQ